MELANHLKIVANRALEVSNRCKQHDLQYINNQQQYLIKRLQKKHLNNQKQHQQNFINRQQHLNKPKQDILITDNINNSSTIKNKENNVLMTVDNNNISYIVIYTHYDNILTTEIYSYIYNDANHFLSRRIVPKEI